MSTKHGFMPVSVSRIPIIVQSIEYKQARFSSFSSFSKGLHQLCVWLAKYNCNDVCMESTGKYWIPVFNILEQHKIRVTLSHPKYTKPLKGNKTDRKDAKWITCAAW